MTLEWIRSRTTETPSGCWEWNGARKHHGYGILSVGGKCQIAHRVAWVLAGGNLGASDCVLHRCDNPPCCNPAHLFVGTQYDNIKDCIDKGRHAFRHGDSRRAKPEHMPRGSAHAKAAFTEKQVADIRYRIVHKLARRIDIAKEFGVDPSTISNIMRGRTWRHVR